MTHTIKQKHLGLMVKLASGYAPWPSLLLKFHDRSVASSQSHTGIHSQSISVSKAKGPMQQGVLKEKFRNALTLLKGFYERIDHARTLGLAAETAFWLFLSLIPLAAVAGLVAARLATQNLGAIAPLLASLPDAVRQLISTELGKVAAWKGGAVGAPGAIIFVWLASSGVHAIFDALELETGVSRPWWKKRLLAIATCVGLSVGVACLTLLGTGLDWIRHVANGAMPLHIGEVGSTILGRLGRVALGGVVALGLIVGLYWIGVPPQARKQTPMLPGALLAVSLQIILGWAYRLYLAKAGSGSAYQAGLAVIGVTLMALYLFCLALLVGAELNRAIGDAMDKKLQGANPRALFGSSSRTTL